MKEIIYLKLLEFKLFLKIIYLKRMKHMKLF